MSFAHAKLLLLLPIALLLLGVMVLGDVKRRRAAKALGEARLVDALITADAGPRRAIKGALRFLAVALAIVAAARPQYGRGTKVVPAADVNAVVVLDVSKSMYAQDVLPSRLERARSDVTRMIKTLPKIRWGGVAFAGEAVAFPPTSDAPEAAQFLSNYEPVDMPGGTAIARALELARRQLVPQSSGGDQGPPPDLSSRRRKSVIVLVTDGEDLEGDPVAVARQAWNDGIKIHVVAIGGRAPQPIPDIDPDSGLAKGYVHDEDGTLVMTELSPQAEQQLQAIARETKGRYVHTEDGTTGLAAVEAELRALIASEGTERIETLYADVFWIPLGIALILLLLDSVIAEAATRKVVPKAPPIAARRPRAR